MYRWAILLSSNQLKKLHSQNNGDHEQDIMQINLYFSLYLGHGKLYCSSAITPVDGDICQLVEADNSYKLLASCFCLLVSFYCTSYEIKSIEGALNKSYYQTLLKSPCQRTSPGLARPQQRLVKHNNAFIF